MLDVLRSQNSGVPVQSLIHEHVRVGSNFKKLSSSLFAVQWKGVRQITTHRPYYIIFESLKFWYKIHCFFCQW